MGPTLDRDKLATLLEPIEEMHQLTNADSKLLVFEGELAGRKVSILVDSGASTQFMSERLAKELSLPLTEKKVGSEVRLVDGSAIESTHFIEFRYSIGPFSEIELFHLLTLASYDLILGRPWLDRHNPDVDWPNNRMRLTYESKRYTLVARTLKPLENAEAHTLALSTMELSSIEEGGQNAKVSRSVDISGEAVTGQAKTPSRKEAATTSPKFKSELSKLLLEFVDVVPSDPDFQFPFPPARSLDFEIKMIPHEKIPSKVVYKMSPIEQEELRKQLDELIARGFIRPSQSPYGSPVLFVKKKTGDLRMCVDYRAINALTVKWKYPIPDINMLLDQLRGARYFTKIDLNQAYYQIRVAEDSKQYTAMLTRWGLWEWNCMSFGLCNAPSHFSRLMMDIFKEYLDIYVLIFLDDILIYSKTEEDHLQHIRTVLMCLRKHKLFARAGKCDWAQRMLEFLGHVVSEEGIMTDPKKVESVRDWPVPKTKTEILSFKGLASYYRRFVKNFSEISGPLSAMTSDKVPFSWGKAEQESFDRLKEALTTAPVIMPPDPRAPYIISTDASGYAIGGVLSQDQDGLERVVAYESRRLKEAERNYPTHDKELLAVMEMLRKWRHYIQNGHTTKVYTDNIATKYILTKPTLMGRQKKWAEQLADYDVEILHRAGKLNIAADALSRRSDYDIQANHSLEWSRMAINSLEWIPIQQSLIDDVRADSQHDKDYQAILADVVAKKRKDYAVLDGLLYLNTRLVVPSRHIQESLIQLAHDGPLGGHLGRNKTLERLQRCYSWSRMSYDVLEYCRTCPTCQLVKPSQQKALGLLQPLPIPGRPWESIGMDFITGLPVTPENYSVLMTVVDRLSKFLVLIPTTANFDALTVADLFLTNVVKRFGFPLSIVSDRDPRFISAFWKGLMAQAGIKRRMSSAAHPQSDGVTEQANRTIASMLRSYAKDSPTTWAKGLAAVEIAYNDSVNASTGFTPYYLCSGSHPILPLSLYAEPKFLDNTTVEKSVQEYTGHMSEEIARAREAMLRAQAEQTKQANKSRRELFFKIGDLVLLSEGHFRDSTQGNLAQADGATKKLNAIYRGPFKVTEVISPVSYRLDLPKYMRMTHNAFHVSRLRPYLTTTLFPTRAATLVAPAPQLEGNEEHFEIEKFCGHRQTGRDGRYLQILVQYKGSTEKEWQFCADLSSPPGLDTRTYYRMLSSYFAQHPKGTGSKGRPPNEIQLASLLFRLQDEVNRAKGAAKEGLTKTKLRSDTSLKKVKKDSKSAEPKAVPAGADTLGGGGEPIPDLPKNQLPTTNTRVPRSRKEKPKQQPSPLHGTREERAKARAYVSEDKESDTLFKNLTKREYRVKEDSVLEAQPQLRRSSERIRSNKPS
jgi:hypothetical protein